MTKKLFFGLLVLVLIALPLLSACTTTSTSTPTSTTSPTTTTAAITSTKTPTPTYPVIKVRMGSPFPGPPANTSAGVVYWEDLITKASGGNITFDNNWNGSLFASGESVDAIKNRVVDISFTSASYGAAGPWPLRNFVTNVPFNPSDLATNLKVTRQLWDATPAFANELAGTNAKELCSVGMGLPYDIISTTPIKTLDDLKGKKVACVGVGALCVADAGGTPVTMSITDRYVGLQRGTIDAMLAGPDSDVDYKFYEVAKNFTTVGLTLSTIWGGVYANLDWWKSLTPETQNLFLSVRDQAEAYMVKLMNDNVAKAKATLTEKGSSFYTMSDADVSKWIGQMKDYPADWVKNMNAKGLPGQQILDTYMKLCSDAGWKWPRQWGKQ